MCGTSLNMATQSRSQYTIITIMNNGDSQKGMVWGTNAFISGRGRASVSKGCSCEPKIHECLDNIQKALVKATMSDSTTNSPTGIIWNRELIAPLQLHSL